MVFLYDEIMFLTIVVFIIILSVLVLVHELGHFLVAKKLGVKVEEFGVGFPPRVYGKKIGETLYSINMLPIGGFVKLYGEDSAGGGKVGKVKSAKSVKGVLKRAFFARPAWQRASIVVAGVVMNYLLATAIITYLFITVGLPVQGSHVIVVGVTKDSPASMANFHVGDMLLKVNGKNIQTPTDVISATQKSLGKQILIHMRTKNNVIRDVAITPRIHAPTGQGPMGVAISTDVKTIKYTWYEAPFFASVEALKECWLIIQGIWTTLTELIITRKVPQGVAGPVGIAQLTGQFVKIGPDAVLSLVSLLSLNLAVLNVLPIPALDGGRLFFILIEGVIRRKVNSEWEAYAHNVGMLLLLALIALITLHDIIRLISGQPILPKM